MLVSEAPLNFMAMVASAGGTMAMVPMALAVNKGELPWLLRTRATTKMTIDSTLVVGSKMSMTKLEGSLNCHKKAAAKPALSANVSPNESDSAVSGSL